MEVKTNEEWRESVEEWLKLLHKDDLEWLINVALKQRFDHEFPIV